MKKVPGYICILALAMSLHASSTAQHTVGRWAVGLGANANAWFNDYNQRIVGLGGDIVTRYGFSRRISVGVEFGYEVLKTGQDPLKADAPYDYLRLEGTPISLLGWFHLLPGKPAAPYLFAGVGLLRYKRSITSEVYIPDARDRGSFRVPFGVGIETFTQKGFSFNFNVGYVVLNDATEMLKKGLPDGYVNVKFGINVYLGSSDDEDDDEDGLTNAREEELGTNPTNPDTDEDGLSDGAEVRKYHTDPLNADSDFDRLKDGEEIFKYMTDPLKADTDGDGFSDGEEVFAGTDPLNPKSHP
ncbi:MAG: outer membrane beta-barrel protein [Bacteroidota bacterium]